MAIDYASSYAPWARAGTLLAAHARATGAPHGVVLVRPPARPAVPNPFASGFMSAEVAIRKVLPVAAVVEAQAQGDATAAVEAALRQTRSRVVLAWNDLTAIGAAAALGPGGYAGGLGAPSLSGREAVRALRGGGPLRCLVAARLARLADALVAVPLAYLRGRGAGGARVAMKALTPGSPQLARFAGDFAA